MAVSQNPSADSRYAPLHDTTEGSIVPVGLRVWGTLPRTSFQKAKTG